MENSPIFTERLKEKTHELLNTLRKRRASLSMTLQAENINESNGIYIGINIFNMCISKNPIYKIKGTHRSGNKCLKPIEQADKMYSKCTGRNIIQYKNKYPKRRTGKNINMSLTKVNGNCQPYWFSGGKD
jgi:hypothetical protein